MKITVGRLKTIIQEELNELKLKRGESSYKRDEGEESPEEELGSEAHAESAEQTDIILGDLKQILEDWSAAAPEDSDEELFRVYAQDIQKLVDKYEGEEEHDCDCDHEDHAPHDCDCEHSEKSHEEREGEEESPKPKKKSKPKEKKEKGEESSTPKKAGKSGGKNFPYESKQLEQAIYQKLITAFGEE